MNNITNRFLVEQARKQPVTAVYFRGQEVYLKYTESSMIRLKDEYGINLFEDWRNSGDPFEILHITWAGLLEEFPDVTVLELSLAYEAPDLKGLVAAFITGINSYLLE